MLAECGWRLVIKREIGERLRDSIHGQLVGTDEKSITASS